MRNVIAGTVAAALALGLTAYSARAQAPDLSALKGCYIESSVAGTFLRTDREAHGGIGGGCDLVVGVVIIGGGIRADFGDWSTGTLFGKAGITVNPHASVYGLAEWRIPEWKVKSAGQLAIGAGSEIALTSIAKGLSLFGEGTIVASKFGPGASKDDVVVRLGARYRF